MNDIVGLELGKKLEAISIELYKTAADFAFEFEGKKYEVNIDDVTKEIA